MAKRRVIEVTWLYSPQHCLLHLCILRIDQQKECLIPKNLWHNLHTFPARKSRCIMSSSCIFGLKHANRIGKGGSNSFSYTSCLLSEGPRADRRSVQKPLSNLSTQLPYLIIDLPSTCPCPPAALSLPHPQLHDVPKAPENSRGPIPRLRRKLPSPHVDAPGHIKSGWTVFECGISFQNLPEKLWSARLLLCCSDDWGKH